MRKSSAEEGTPPGGVVVVTAGAGVDLRGRRCEEQRWEYDSRQRLGHGSFGTIFLGRDVASGGRVAVKVEPRHCQHPQVAYEARLYSLYAGKTGFPTAFNAGKDALGRTCLVMEVLGPSLEDLFQRCQRQLALSTVLALAEQMLQRIETFHSRGYVHRDLKPENWLIGAGTDASTLYVIDFGLAKKYFDRASRRHQPFRGDKKLTGTARYASLNTHAGCEQSRRDDLEAIGYMLLYFLRGKLPWQGLGGTTKEIKYQRIFDCKKNTPLEELCAGLPTEFGSYMRYCRSLSYEEVPNYSSLRKLFRDLWVLKGFGAEDCYEWNRLPPSVAAVAATEAPSTTDASPSGGAAPSSSEQKAAVVDASIVTPTQFVLRKG